MGMINGKVIIANSIGQLPESLHTAIEKANAFYSPEYALYEEKNNSIIIYVYDENFIQVVAIHKIHNFFCTASFLSEPVCISDDECKEGVMEAFLDKTVAILDKEFGADWLTVTPASSLFTAYPACSERIRFGNYVIDLSLDEDALFAGVTSKHRNMIRRGEKSELEVKFGSTDLLEDYITVDKQTWKRSGKTIDNTDYYRKYVESLAGKAIVSVAYKDGIPQCGIIGLYNKRMFYYMYGASADSPEPGSTHYLQWRMILKMKAENVRYYNFVGCRINEDENSKYHNIQHFKKGFGGTLEECYLFRATLHHSKKVMFDLLMKLRTGKAPNDVIDQEIDKWRDINISQEPTTK